MKKIIALTLILCMCLGTIAVSADTRGNSIPINAETTIFSAVAGTNVVVGQTVAGATVTCSYMNSAKKAGKRYSTIADDAGYFRCVVPKLRKKKTFVIEFSKDTYDTKSSAVVYVRSGKYGSEYLYDECGRQNEYDTYGRLIIR